MDAKTRQGLRDFCIKRTQIHRRLKNASLLSTSEGKQPEPDKALENAAKALKKNNVKLVAVAHIIARAIHERQIHENIAKEHKERVYEQREAKKEYARLRERLKNKVWRELNRLDMPLDFSKDDVINRMKSEERIKKLFQTPALGRLFEAWSKKDSAAWRKKRWTKSAADNPPTVYLNNFCLRMIALYEEKDITLDSKYVTIIADLINAFTLSPKKQTYHTVHNRISRLTK